MKINIIKNNADQNGANGNWATAAGYATNAKPGPRKKGNHFFWEIFISVQLPESATSLTFRPSVFAINPITEKMTKPLIKQVPSLNAAKISVSLENNFICEILFYLNSYSYL